MTETNELSSAEIVEKMFTVYPENIQGNKYDYLLNKFIPNGERLITKRPYSLDEDSSVISTDAYILLKVPSKLVEASYKKLEDSGYRNVEYVYNMTKIQSVRPDLTGQEDWWKGVLSITEIERILRKQEGIGVHQPPIEDCRSCDASGEVSVDYRFEGENFLVEATCPICDGHGEIVHHQEHSSYVLSDKYALGLDGKMFKPNFLSRMVKIAKILSVDGVQFRTGSECQSAHFKIGQCILLVMGLGRYADTEDKTVVDISEAMVFNNEETLPTK